MTVFEKAQQPSAASEVAAAPPRGRLAVEFADTLKLAAPMALTQLGQIVMMTIDLALIGRLGDEAIAAAALANTVYFVSFTLGLGVVSAVAPLAAQAFGARDPHRVRRSLRVGLWAALLISLPMMIFPFYGEQILRMLGQAETPARLAQPYLLGLVWGATPALWLIAIRGFMGALNRPEPVLWITLAAIPANAVLVYLLIHGAWVLPPLGLFGTTALAAHQIALQVTAILFMVPLGISMAATVRVGHAAGRNDADGVKRAGLAAVSLGILLGGGMTTLV